MYVWGSDEWFHFGFLSTTWEFQVNVDPHCLSCFESMVSNYSFFVFWLFSCLLAWMLVGFLIRHQVLLLLPICQVLFSGAGRVGWGWGRVGWVGGRCVGGFVVCWCCLWMHGHNILTVNKTSNQTAVRRRHAASNHFPIRAGSDLAYDDRQVFTVFQSLRLHYGLVCTDW